MLSNIILNGFPRIRNQFMKYTFFYLGALFFLVQYYFYIHEYYWLIAFIALFIIGYFLCNQNTHLVGDQNDDFKELHEKMKVLIPEDQPITNYLYADPTLLEFLYQIKGFQLADKKNFDEMILRINRFLQIYDEVNEKKEAKNLQLEKMELLKNEALNFFHSILYKLVNDREMNRHNELRYVLEEQLVALFNECTELRKGFINFNEFGYNPMRNAHFDLY